MNSRNLPGRLALAVMGLVATAAPAAATTGAVSLVSAASKFPRTPFRQSTGVASRQNAPRSNPRWRAGNRLLGR